MWHGAKGPYWTDEISEDRVFVLRKGSHFGVSVFPISANINQKHPLSFWQLLFKQCSWGLFFSPNWSELPRFPVHFINHWWHVCKWLCNSLLKAMSAYIMLIFRRNLVLSPVSLFRAALPGNVEIISFKIRLKDLLAEIYVRTLKIPSNLFDHKTNWPASVVGLGAIGVTWSLDTGQRWRWSLIIWPAPYCGWPRGSDPRHSRSTDHDSENGSIVTCGSPRWPNRSDGQLAPWLALI